MTNIIDPASQKSHLHQQMHSEGNTTRVQTLHSEHFSKMFAAIGKSLQTM